MALWNMSGCLKAFGKLFRGSQCLVNESLFFYRSVKTALEDLKQDLEEQTKLVVFINIWIEVLCKYILS